MPDTVIKSNDKNIQLYWTQERIQKRKFYETPTY